MHALSSPTPAPSKGILYVYGIATPIIEQYRERWTSRIGQSRGPYLDELTASVASVRNFTSLQVALITDADTLPSTFLKLFDHVGRFDSSAVGGGWGEKIVAMPMSPFEYTLFLDADVVACAPFDYIYDILDYFEVAVSMEPPLSTWRPSEPRGMINGLSAPVYRMLQINSGVVLFRRSEQVFHMFRIWRDLHAAASKAHLSRNISVTDQAYMLAALLQANVRFMQLPINFNFRFHGNVAPISVRGDVVILHTRDRNEARACHIVNQQLGYRMQHPRHGTLPVADVLWDKL